MISAISRSARLLLVFVLAGVALAGCGSGPSRAGAAAIVGNTAIPLSEVQAWYKTLLRKEPTLKPELQRKGQMDELGRRLTAHAVQRELTFQAARAERVTVDERRVSDVIAQLGGPRAATAGKIYLPENFREEVRSQLLTTELGRKYFDRLSIVFDYTQASTRREAEAKARRMAQGPEQTAALIESDRQAKLPAQAGRRMRAAQSPQVAGMTPLFGAKPGTVLAFETQPRSAQWLVVRIKERGTEPAAPSSPAAQANERTLQALGTQLLGITADRVGVRLNPRYGVWDPIALGSAPNAGETMGFRLPSRYSARE